MKIASHNSWSYLTLKTWWMKLIRFAARCQDVSVYEQYDLGVRGFDLRVRFDEHNQPQLVHGCVVYKSAVSICEYLYDLNCKKDVYIRVILDVRTKKQYTVRQIDNFKDFCSAIEDMFPNIKFYCGDCLYNHINLYDFKNHPTCEELYSSVCPPKLIDDWYPRWYAKRNNKKNIEKGTDKDFLMIDFVNIR